MHVIRRSHLAITTWDDCTGNQAILLWYTEESPRQHAGSVANGGLEYVSCITSCNVIAAPLSLFSCIDFTSNLSKLLIHEQCDQSVPTCGQCIRTKRVCPGYRNMTDLVIFDQSQQTAQRSKKRSLAPTRSIPTSTSSHEPVTTHRSDSPPVQLYDFSCHSVLEDVAIKHFMHHHIGRDSNSSQFGYLPNYYSYKGFHFRELQQSLKAAGLAGYARLTQRADILYAATKSYVDAVRNINSVMSGPDLVGREATLMSVMLLSVFEVMITPRALGLENLTKHLKGAMSIAYLFVKKAKLTELHRKLLGTVIQASTIAYWTQDKPLPPEFPILLREASFHPDSIHARFMHIVIGLMQFRAVRDEGLLLPEAVCLEAQRLDSTLGRFAEGVSRHVRFDTITEPTRELVYNGYYHGWYLSTE
jgi:hypothetical protein